MITDTNWRHYAPQVDIDLDKFPNAMAAPEHIQGQVAGLMWAREGLMPWAPYNKKLRQDLNIRDAGSPVVRPAAEATPAPAKSAAAHPHNWDVFPDEPEDQQAAAPVPDAPQSDTPQ